MNITIQLPKEFSIESINQSLLDAENIEKITCFSEPFNIDSIPHEFMFETVPEDEYAQVVLYKSIPSSISGFETELIEVGFSDPEYEDISSLIDFSDIFNSLSVTVIDSK